MKRIDATGLQVLAAGDVVFLAIGAFVALAVGVGWEASAQAIGGSFFFLLHWAVMSFWVFRTLETFGNSGPGRSLWFQTVLVGVLVSGVVAVSLSLAFSGLDDFRIILGAAVPLQFLLVSCWRFLFMAFWVIDGRGSVLLFAGDAEKTDLATRLQERHVGRSLKIVVGSHRKETVEGSPAGLDVVCIGSDVDPDMRKAISDRYLWESRRIVLVPQTLEIALHGAQVNRLGDCLVLEIEPLGLSGIQKAVKRFLDLVTSIVSLPVVVPLWLLISLVVRLTSPGPALIKQERVGQGGKVFALWKFRTMVKDAESRTGPVLAGAKDPRITRVGRVLRAARLDELPQLVNVIRGEMSIVGPRPERPHFVREFAQSISDYRYRFLAKPGLTGLAQVMGTYATGAKDKLGYDLLYIREYSLWLDVKIMLLTLMVVVTPESARGIAGAPPRRGPAVF